MVDEARLHRDRLARTRASLRRHGIPAALLCDPMNVRYAAVTGPMVVCNLHTSYRYVLVPVEATPILWEYPKGLWGVPAHWEGDVRTAIEFTFFGSGSNTAADAGRFAHEVGAALGELGLAREPLGVDRLETVGHLALQAAGISLVDAQPALEEARAVKTVDELEIMRRNASACDNAISALLERLAPGVTENELWSTFIGAAYRQGAEWCETRLLSSGLRTNPWFHEATDRVVEPGDLVAFDTDLVGESGYLTDISRTYLCGGRPPTDEQRRLFAVAYEYVHENMAEFRPGAAFAELGARLAERFPPEFRPRRYPMIAHGSGMVDEYPSINWEHHHDGEVEAGMVLSVEAYVGAVNGREGVKLEEQIIVTEGGYENLSSAPFDERLVPR